MVEGIDKLKLRFQLYSKKILSEARPAMLAGADKVVGTAKLLVPRDSGHLATTIKRSGIQKTKKGNDMVEISAGDASTTVGARKQFQLARIVEFGAQGRPAQPYLRPAMRRHRNAIRSAMRRAMGRALKG